MSIRAEDVAGLDLSDVAGTERIGPVVPGEVLREEFMAPLGLSGRALARELGVPSNRITEIVAGERAILLKRRSCLPSGLAHPPSFGSTCKRRTTSRWRVDACTGPHSPQPVRRLSAQPDRSRWATTPTYPARNLSSLNDLMGTSEEDW